MRFFILLTLLLYPIQAICQDLGTNIENDTGINIDKNINVKEENSKKITRYQNNLLKIPTNRFKKHAVIQILDKTTAKTLEKKLKLKEEFTYSTIKITAHRCWQAPSSEKPDSKILLEINEVNPKDEADIKNIFLGWMIASSPSVSGLEHPIYDISAINCQDD